MIIESVTIENFMCYYGSNIFHFQEGLNIVIGENGEGKTKFFEALEWLFKGKDLNLRSAVSAKKLDEVSIGESFNVSVTIKLVQFGENRILRRSYLATKEGDNDVSLGNPFFDGIEEKSNGERSKADPHNILNQAFPAQIRKYSMFKGESELDIFKNRDALLELVNLFASASRFEKYAKTGKELFNKANDALSADSKKNESDRKKLEKFDVEIKRIEAIIKAKNAALKNAREQLEHYNTSQEKAEKLATNGEELNKINDRIKDLRGEIAHQNSLIKDKYTTYLLDDRWILESFEPIQEIYTKKISAWDKERRKLQNEHQQAIGMQKGERQAISKLLGELLPLDPTVPSKEVMDEMIADKHCKVCNTPAPEGSPQLEFMKKRLEAYLESQKPEVDENEDYFKHNYYQELNLFSKKYSDTLRNLRGVRNEIIECIEFNKSRKEDIQKLENQYIKATEEKSQLLVDALGDENAVANAYKNILYWEKDKGKYIADAALYQREIEEKENELKDVRKEHDAITVKTGNPFLIGVRTLMRDIDKIFTDTKNRMFDEFLTRLQEKSNYFFNQINKGAFTGNIVISKNGFGENIKLDVELYEADRKFYNPNQSLATSMHISVLFAISKLAEESREESYPLILDAPTSSFGETKTMEFLNIISETEGQIILLTKDFIETDVIRNELRIKEEFKEIKKHHAQWVRLKRPFDENNLRTLNTEVITL